MSASVLWRLQSDLHSWICESPSTVFSSVIVRSVVCQPAGQLHLALFYKGSHMIAACFLLFIIVYIWLLRSWNSHYHHDAARKAVPLCSVCFRDTQIDRPPIAEFSVKICDCGLMLSHCRLRKPVDDAECFCLFNGLLSDRLSFSELMAE